MGGYLYLFNENLTRFISKNMNYFYKCETNDKLMRIILKKKLISLSEWDLMIIITINKILLKNNGAY